MISDDDYCRLCTTSNDSLIDIFGEQGLRWNISTILSSHFWFVVNIDDEFSNKICTTCWWKVENFHVFYVNIQVVQETLEQKVTANNETKSICDNIIVVEDAGVDEKPINDDRLENITIDLEKYYSSFNEADGLSDNASMQSAAEPDIAEDKSLIETNAFQITEPCYLKCNDEIGDSTVEIKSDHQPDEPNKKKKIVPETGIVPNRLKRRKRDLPKTLDEDDLIRNWCDMQCTECDYAFYRFPDVKRHYRDKHNMNGFIICCKRKFFRRVRILEHIACHLDPDTFRCEMCNKNFADKAGLMNHMDGHAPPEKRQFQCDQCVKSYAKKFQLYQHKKLRHASSKDKVFVCDDCGKAFVSKSILQTHVRGVHGNSKQFICDICAKTFKRKHYFEQHCLEHAEILRPKVQCSICNAWLKHKNSLRNHMARHADSVNIYKCDICGKPSPTKAALRSHQKYVHFSTKTFKCSICEKAFKKSIALKEHLSLHTGEALYTCPYCPKTFNSGGNMHSHRKKVHTKLWEEEKSNRMIESKSVQVN